MTPAKLASFVLLAGRLLAQSGTIEGTVTNGISAEPIKKAMVILYSFREQFGYQAVTDAAGRFHFEKLDPGSYYVTATRDGFAIPQLNSYRQGPFVLAEEQTVKSVAIKLMPFGSAAGRILDEDGDPIANAQVRAMQYDYRFKPKQLHQYKWVSTNDLGLFEFRDLPPGRYYFLATPSLQVMTLPSGTHSSSKQQAYPPTFYPNALDLNQATASEISYGDHLTNLDVRLSKAPAFYVRGKMVNGQTGESVGLAAVRAEVLASGANLGSQFFVNLRRDGSFDAGPIPRGAYRLIAQRTDAAGRSVWAQRSVSISDRDVDDVVLALSPGLEISGRVSVEGPVQDPVNAQVSFQAMPGNRSPGAPNMEGDGSFTFHDIFPGFYSWIVVTGRPRCYVKSIRFGERDLSAGIIDLTGSASGKLNIVIGTDGGQVQGTAETQDGEPAPFVTTAILPAKDELSGRGDLFQNSDANQNGQFQFRGLAPGQYKVFAWDGDPSLFQNLELRKAFESRAATVDIGSNGYETVQVKVISAEDIERQKSKLP